MSFTYQNKHVIKIVEKQKKIQVGNYCVFQCLDGHDFLIGLVLLLALQNNTNKSAAMWEWDVERKHGMSKHPHF